MRSARCSALTREKCPTSLDSSIFCLSIASARQMLVSPIRIASHRIASRLPPVKASETTAQKQHSPTDPPVLPPFLVMSPFEFVLRLDMEGCLLIVW